jgi:hypothetical protein
MTFTSPVWLRSIGIGFLYWLAFLLVLEPGNVLHAQSMGRTLEFDREAMRIGVAALLGSSITPVLIALTRRFPLTGPGGWRHAGVHAGSIVGLAFLLILISCFLAAWILLGQTLPEIDDVRRQLAANWLLLVFAISAFTAISHAMQFLPRSPESAQASPIERLDRVAVKTRGRLGYVDVASIDWIESQGNYLALHVGDRAHLIRETLASFESRLDADRFVRVHRRMIVAVDRIREIQPLTNGDSTLILQHGRELRASRRYRDLVRKRWAEVAHRLPNGLPRTES